MSVLQVIGVTTILFILYRFLLKTIGIQQLGIWSLVLATTTATQVANLGFSGSVVKFVAKYIAQEQNEKASAVIQTAALSIAIFLAFVLSIGYPIAKWVLGLIVADSFLPASVAILPYAFFALWVMVITNVFYASLDGCQRIDLRCLLILGGSMTNLLACFILAPIYGLMGVAYARVAQNVMMFILSWILLKRYFPLLPSFPYKWSRNIFNEIIGYGINFQTISVSAMFYDPITKALLSKFGGLSMVGYYEMASRIIMQLRAVLISANQAIVPAIAGLEERLPKEIRSIYLSSYQLIFYLSLPLFSLIIIATPVISQLWIGHYEQIFVVFTILLGIGWFLNTLAGPAYFTNLGTGELRWNVIGHVVIAVLNAGLGFLLGMLYNGIGVVVAWILSLSLGSSLIYISYHIRHKLPFMELIPKTSRKIIGACLIATLSAFIIHTQLNYVPNPAPLIGLLILSSSIVIFVPFWRHPMRKRLAGWITDEILNRRVDPHT